VLRLHFRRQRFGRRHRSAMGQAFRLCGEYGLLFGVRLSDDCYRSVAVWAKGTVKVQSQDLIGVVSAFM